MCEVIPEDGPRFSQTTHNWEQFWRSKLSVLSTKCINGVNPKAGVSNWDAGYAKEVPQDEITTSCRVWYLPHHGVINERKPGKKLRIVFDCAAVHKGLSLNQVWTQGPDLVNNLAGVLLRFRRESVALVADVESGSCRTAWSTLPSIFVVAWGRYIKGPCNLSNESTFVWWNVFTWLYSVLITQSCERFWCRVWACHSIHCGNEQHPLWKVRSMLTICWPVRLI